MLFVALRFCSFPKTDESVEPRSEVLTRWQPGFVKSLGDHFKQIDDSHRRMILSTFDKFRLAESEQDPSLACGACVMVYGFNRSSLVEPMLPVYRRFFADAMRLYRRVSPVEMTVQDYVRSSAMLNLKSLQLTCLWMTLGEAKHLPASELLSSSWWPDVRDGAVAFVKINLAGRLSSLPKMDVHILRFCLDIVAMAATLDESQRSIVIEASVDTALEYACLHGFVYAVNPTQTTAKNAAAAAVALQGRDEGGKRLSREVVNLVVDGFCLYFKPGTYHHDVSAFTNGPFHTAANAVATVSYTHLTLPTKRIV